MDRLEAVLENAVKIVDWRDGLACPICGKVATYATALTCTDDEGCPVAFFRRVTKKPATSE